MNSRFVIFFECWVSFSNFKFMLKMPVFSIWLMIIVPSKQWGLWREWLDLPCSDAHLHFVYKIVSFFWQQMYCWPGLSSPIISHHMSPSSLLDVIWMVCWMVLLLTLQMPSKLLHNYDLFNHALDMVNYLFHYLYQHTSFTKWPADLHIAQFIIYCMKNYVPHTQGTT